MFDELTVDGRTGIVLERVDGQSMLALLPAKPWLLFKMAHRFADLHSAIHQTAGTHLPPLRPYLQAQVTRANGVAARIKDHAQRALAELPDGQALCHFDFHPDQIIMTESGPVVIDWMTALQGDPLADVARTSTLIRFAQAPHANRFVRTLTDAVRLSFHAQYLNRYARRTSAVTLQALSAWLVPVAVARLAEEVPGERDAILAFLEKALV
jgi:aminoglycoside phosphotransferase (APT) family kinase protein